jgi:hypothetical protein
MAHDGPYRVSWLPQAAEALRRAAQSTEGRDLAQVVRAIMARLTSDPTGFGDIYRSRGAIEEYHAALDGVAINFAVDTQREYVVVRTFAVLS